MYCTYVAVSIVSGTHTPGLHGCLGTWTSLQIWLDTKVLRRTGVRPIRVSKNAFHKSSMSACLLDWNVDQMESDVCSKRQSRQGDRVQ